MSNRRKMCRWCEKVAYASHQQAYAVGSYRGLMDNRKLRVYECPVLPGKFHLTKHV